jgi:hypothetical protein
MIAFLECLVVLALTYLLMVALGGVGLALGSVEVSLLLLVALVVMVLVVRADRRRRRGP